MSGSTFRQSTPTMNDLQSNSINNLSKVYRILVKVVLPRDSDDDADVQTESDYYSHF
ncbi:hypothetical protein HanIR_Chr04g0184291 [Helianthus annuus]|nr:hypothetical protein HanIR_Chr04g0184291 [Helianthus annuus]